MPILNKQKNNLIFIFILLLLSWFLFVFKLPFPGTDDIHFKQPGVNLMRGLNFANPAAKGYLPGIEEYFLFYPPIYPFMCGVWFLIFGFSISASLSLTILISLATVLVLLKLFQRVVGDKLPGYLYGILFLIWTISIQGGSRPEPLLILLSSVLLLLIQGCRQGAGNLCLKDLNIILIIGLSLGTSFVLGNILMLLMFFIYISVNGSKAKEALRFAVFYLLGLFLSLIIWVLPAHSHLYLFKDQVFDVLRRLKGSTLIAQVWQGLNFSLRYGNIVFFIPLFALMVTFFFKSIFGESNSQKKKALILKAWGFIITITFILLKASERYPYQLALLVLFFYFSGIITVQRLGKLKNNNIKRNLQRTIWVCLFIAYLPFLKLIAYPFTWGKEDSYEFNKKIILNNIPQGSKVIASREFWYELNNKYDLFDGYSGIENIYASDYLLYASGGGNPFAGRLSELKYSQYFKEHFVKKLSTMIAEPNKILGIPISNSRWCYRFTLYKRVK